MMIERMQTHPDDFKYGGKLHHMSENGDLSKRDRVALNDAHDKYIKEPNLMVWVLEALMKPDDPKEDERMPKLKVKSRYAMGQNDPRLTYPGQAVEYDLTTYTHAMNLQHIRHVEAQNRSSGFFSKIAKKF
jgi:hypothetical protein